MHMSDPMLIPHPRWRTSVSWHARVIQGSDFKSLSSTCFSVGPEDTWWKAIKPKFQNGMSIQELMEMGRDMAPAFVKDYKKGSL